MSNFEELKAKAVKAAETLKVGRELVHEVLENVATAKTAMSLQEKNEITALLGDVTAESVKLNARIQHG